MKILADTSVWIDHFRVKNHPLAAVLSNGAVVLHPHIIGELALGSLRNRSQIIPMLRDMPQASMATDDEVLAMIEGRELFSKGIGFTDAHLLAATLIDTGTRLWTKDRRLYAVAEALGIAADY